MAEEIIEGQKEEVEALPELETLNEEGKEFNHDEHMLKVQEGLKAILASRDINEIKQIAQSLLEEEGKEAKAKETPEGDAEDMTFEEYIGGGK